MWGHQISLFYQCLKLEFPLALIINFAWSSGRIPEQQNLVWHILKVLWLRDAGIATEVCCAEKAALVNLAKCVLASLEVDTQNRVLS